MERTRESKSIRNGELKAITDDQQESVTDEPLKSTPGDEPKRVSDHQPKSIPNRQLESVPDDELLRRLAELLRQSRHDEADLVAHIGEVDSRRLYAREASPSMFAYCTEVLHLSEAEAYLRIAAARASREHPILLTMLADGRLHLTAVAKLAPHLTVENREALLERAVHKSKREVEELIAELVPRPDAPAVMRKLPSVAPPSVQLRPDGVALANAETGWAGLQARRSGLRPDAVASGHPELRPDAVVVEPLSPARYRVQFTASAQLHDKLERLRALMRSRVPDGDLAAIIEEAVSEKLERLEARRFARTKVRRKVIPSPGAARSTTTSHAIPPATRHIPAAVRRAVYERDGGRCGYEDERGRRCTAREGLEFHHRRPFGFGGDHSVQNVALACRAHNRYLAEVDYGHEAIATHRQPRKRVALSSSPPP